MVSACTFAMHKGGFVDCSLTSCACFFGFCQGRQSHVHVFFGQELSCIRLHRLLSKDLHNLVAVERIGASNNSFVGNATPGAGSRES